MNPWETKDKVTILNHSKFLTVENHTVKLPDGTIIEDWPWIITPDYVNVIAEDDQGRFIFFRQTKYSVGKVCLAPVGGYMNHGEDPLAAAKRELLEETGFESAHWTKLGSYSVDGNRGAGNANLFLARSSLRVAEPTLDDLEEQEMIFLTLAELESALINGEIKVLAWAAAVSLTINVLKNSQLL